MSIYNYAYLKELAQTEKGKKCIDQCKAYYETNFQDTPIEILPFSAYRDFLATGDRRAYEIPYFARRRRLSTLQALAIADDGYLAELEEIMAAICDEFTWLVPAHYYQGNKIDIFSASTARILAETVYIYGDKLSKLIQERVKECIYQKIVQCYENTLPWWEDTNCNWASVCACGIGLSYLFLFAERFEQVKSRLFRTFASYLSGFDEEGYCFEGTTYWRYGFEHFCAFFEIYEKVTGVRPDFVDAEKVKKVIEYVRNARMSKDVYLPFEDGGYPTWDIGTECACVIKLLYPNDFELDEVKPVLPDNNGFYLRVLRGVSLFDAVKPAEGPEESVYYHKSQVFIRKREKYSFAAQCGNNGVIHNHNDVGVFQIVKDNQRVICDFGAGEYTKEYFGTNEQRYQIFACNSLSHSVPIVDGKLQSCGKEYFGTVVRQDENTFAMDIAKAYENGPEQLLVEYCCEKDFVLVNYHAKGIQEKIVFHFVSDIKPMVKEDGVYLGKTRLSSDLPVKPVVTHRKEKPNDPSRPLEIPLRDVYLIDYEVCVSGEIDAQFQFYL